MMYKFFRKAKTSDWSRKLQLKTGNEESVDEKPKSKGFDNVGARRGGFR